MRIDNEQTNLINFLQKELSTISSKYKKLKNVFDDLLKWSEPEDFFQEQFEKSSYIDFQDFCNNYCILQDGTGSDCCDCFKREQEERCADMECDGCRYHNCCDDVSNNDFH